MAPATQQHALHQHVDKQVDKHADDSFASTMLLTGHLTKIRSMMHLEWRRARSILLGNLRNDLSRPLAVRAVFSWLGHDHRERV